MLVRRTYVFHTDCLQNCTNKVKCFLELAIFVRMAQMKGWHEASIISYNKNIVLPFQVFAEPSKSQFPKYKMKYSVILSTQLWAACNFIPKGLGCVIPCRLYVLPSAPLKKAMTPCSCLILTSMPGSTDVYSSVIYRVN